MLRDCIFNCHNASQFFIYQNASRTSEDQCLPIFVPLLMILYFLTTCHLNSFCFCKEKFEADRKDNVLRAALRNGQLESDLNFKTICQRDFYFEFNFVVKNSFCFSSFLCLTLVYYFKSITLLSYSRTLLLKRVPLFVFVCIFLVNTKFTFKALIPSFCGLFLSSSSLLHLQ